MFVGPVRKMAKLSLIKPIVVVLGATGVGKSKLAIEIACKYSGEIVNADAMQMYQGLDIVTNKVSQEERKLCPHHLIDCISPMKLFYDITDYKTSALRILGDIHKRGKLPVIVGGTNYYIEALLWEFVLSAHEKEENEFEELSSNEDSDSSSSSSLPNEDLHDALMRVDPESAKQIHPKDTRKLKRALQVYRKTGKTKTSLLQEQHGKSESTEMIRGSLRYPNSCMIWVQCDQEVLNERLDKRVDEMVSTGLIQELSDFHNNYNRKLSAGHEPNYERGIFQSIGFKEFHDYLTLTDKDNTETSKKAAELFKQGLLNMKLATKRYSRKQIKWIKNRFLSKRGSISIPPTYAVNSTDPSRWAENVREPAFEIVEDFLMGGGVRHTPLPIKDYYNPPIHMRCEDCNKVFLRHSVWQAHITGRKHKNMVERNRKLLLRGDDLLKAATEA